jgi:hypothetical protein
VFLSSAGTGKAARTAKDKEGKLGNHEKPAGPDDADPDLKFDLRFESGRNERQEHL